MPSLLDVVRVVDVALVLVWLGLLAGAAMSAETTPQRWRMIACAALLGDVSATQISRLGEPMSWRLPYTLAVFVVGIWATWMFVFRDDGRAGSMRPHFPEDRR